MKKKISRKNLSRRRNSHDDVTNFILTTIRNCLITLPEASAEEIQNHNGCMIFISLLLQRHSNRQMNFLADSLLRLGLFNSNAQVKKNKSSSRKKPLLFKDLFTNE